MKFSIKNFFSKCDQIRRKLRIWSLLLKKSLMENFTFCAVQRNRLRLSSVEFLLCAKYGVLSGPYFPVFGVNTEIYSINLRIQSKYGKIRTRKNSVYGHFLRSAKVMNEAEDKRQIGRRYMFKRPQSVGKRREKIWSATKKRERNKEDYGSTVQISWFAWNR